MEKDQDQGMCRTKIVDYLDTQFDELLTVVEDIYIWLTENPRDIESHAKGIALKRVAEGIYQDILHTVNTAQDSIGKIVLLSPYGRRSATAEIDYRKIQSAVLEPLKSNVDLKS